MSHDKPASQPAHRSASGPDPAPKPVYEGSEPLDAAVPAADTKTSDRARRREAAQRRLRETTPSKGLAAVLGVTVVTAVAAVTVAGHLWGPPEFDMHTTAQLADLPATSALAVCPGAPALPEGSENGQDLQFSPVSSDAATALTVTANSDLAGNIPGLEYFAATTSPQTNHQTVQLTDSLDPELQQGPPATAASDGTVKQHADVRVMPEPDAAGSPLALAVQPVGGRAGHAAGTIEFAATDGDLAGMTASACTSAAHHHWLTGAITTPGTTAVLTLTNPSTTASTVDLSVMDTTGPVEASGASNIVLAPGQTRSMLVAGLAPRQESVAIEVSAAGGPIAADISQHRLDGIVAAGVDSQQAGVAGSTVVIPGLTISEETAEIASASGLDGQTPSLHLASTGSAASATITLRGPNGPVRIPAAASAVELEAGATTTVDLSDVEPGTYAVEISADARFVASATSVAWNPTADNPDATGNAAAVDTAYMPSTRTIQGETMVALPSLGNPTSRLVLTAATDATVNITPLDAQGEAGEPRVQEVAAETAVTITDEDAAAYLVETGGQAVHAGVLVESSAGISAFPVNTVRETGAGLPVRLGY